MEFVSILNNRTVVHKDRSIPAFLVDLNLDQVVEQIQAYSLIPVKKYYYDLPEDTDCEDYRRAVYADVKNAQVNILLAEFVQSMEERKQALERKKKVELGVQQAVWHMREVAAYCDGLSKLYRGLLPIQLSSVGLQSLREYLGVYVSSEAFITMQKKAWKLSENLQSLCVKLTIENDQMIVTEERVSGTYDSFLREVLGEHNMQMRSPFSQNLSLCDLEQEIVRRSASHLPELFDEIEAFYHKYREYQDEPLTLFGDEISYYLSYYTFQQKMELEGFAFVTPTVDENRDMYAQGLYDLALACASLKSHKEVVSNSMVYGKRESFFVLTGPNQGGKTTFARSLGQLVYLCKMGLDVPATAANVHAFSNILTHFSVEESVETGRGKLMDELIRLKPMMHTDCRNAFVVINELFTTAANYDACIMGKKVLEHFIKQECRGIYVTHLKELTEAHESIVSLRAMLDEKNVQNFKIQRHEAEEQAYAINQVNKHRLTYEQLKERLR